MLSPKLFLEMRKFHQQDSRAYPLKPLDDLADIMCRTIGYEHMDMIARDLAGDNVNLVLYGNLPQNISGSCRYVTSKYPLPVFRYPDEVNF